MTMKRMPRLLWGLPIAGALTAVGVFWTPHGTSAPNPAGAGNEKVADLRPAVSLPITQVILFNSGVGHFTRSGEVEGDARVDLTFPETDINDLLKSMVLADTGKGRISAVS